MASDPTAIPVVKAEPLQQQQTQQAVQVQVPHGVSAGEVIAVQINGQTVQAQVPPGVPPGGVFSVALATSAAPPAAVVAQPVQPNDMQIARAMQQREMDLSAAEMAVAGGLGGGLPILNPAEELVLNYQHSIKCFAMIDIFFTMLDVIFGNYFSLFLLIGPICGYFGAMRLQRNKIGIYIAFCAVKCVVTILMFFRVKYFWYLILVFCQLYITSFVYKFWRVLGLVDTSRLEMLLDPRYRQGHHVRFVYM